MNKKIAITGMGVISATGKGITETSASLRAGKRNAGKPSVFKTETNCPVFEIKDVADRGVSGLGRSIDIARIAIDEAMRNAGFETGFGNRKCGMCLGTILGTQINDNDFYPAYKKTGLIQDDFVKRFFGRNLVERMAHEYGCTGPLCQIVNACSSGADSIGLGMSMLLSGECDVMVAGGSDELSGIILSGFESLGAASDAPCAPFDRDRKGLNLGEGAGIFILEREEDMLRRGRKPDLYAAGFGAVCDAYHITAPLPDGKSLEASIKKALSDANVMPEDIGFVNAHGTATRENDIIEGNVLGRVFGPDVDVLSTKGYTGHTLGAAGAIEAVYTAMALKEGWIPASAGFVNRDEKIPFEPVREVTTVKKRHALSTSLAFGGTNAALVIEIA